MYNQSQKERFLIYYKEEKRDTPSMIDRAVIVLRRIEKFESKWGKDICFQDDPSEIQKVINEVSCIKSGTISGQILVLREYCNWCLLNVPNSCSTLLEIRKPTTDKFKSKTVANPIQLQIILNKLFDPESEKNFHSVYRAMLWIAFMGFTESEAFELTTDEVDINNRVIIHNDILSRIYEESVPAIQNCKELDYFQYTNTNYIDNTISRPRFPGNKLLRGYKTNPSKGFNAEISRIQTKAVREGKLETAIRYNTIWMSGIFYHAFQQEQIGILPDFRGVAIRDWEHIQKQKSNTKDFEYDPKNPEKKFRVDTIERNLKRDYKRWKKAHYET